MKALLMRVWSYNEFYDEVCCAIAPISTSLVEDVERYAEIVTQLQGPQGDLRVYGISAFDSTLYWLRAFPEDEALMSVAAVEEYDATGYTVVEMPDTKAEDFVESYKLARVDVTTMQIYTDAVCWEAHDHYSNDALYTATVSLDDLKEVLECK